MISLITSKGLIDIENKYFPDNSAHITFTPEVKEITGIFWKYETDEEIFSIFCLKRHFEKTSKEIDLFMPYIPHARMDRQENHNDIFTLKYFSEILNSLNFNSIVVLDPHSNVSTALINNIIVIHPDKKIEKIKKEYNIDLLFFPDAGANGRYGYLGEHTYGIKERKWETGKIVSYDIAEPEKVKNKNILIVDDICSYGTTFLEAAKVLKENGAKNIYLYISHCEPNIFKGKLYENKDYIKNVFVNNLLSGKNQDKDWMIIEYENL